VTVIATDKTGTLTETRMEGARFEPDTAQTRLLEIGMFSNDAVSDGTDFKGDAVDAALLRAAKKAGLDIKVERQDHPILNEFTFDNMRKRMSTISMRDGRPWAAVKGAPESVIAQCTHILKGETVEDLTDTSR